MSACLAPGDSPADSAVVVLHAGATSPESSPLITPISRYGRGPFIRNCFVDGGAVAQGGVGRPQFRALSLGACLGGVAEGDQVHNTWFGGHFQQGVSTRSALVRNNHYRNVVTGPFWHLDQLSEYLPVESLTREDGTLTGACSQNHYLAAGDRVCIQGVPGFDGCFRVRATPTPSSFEYADAWPDGSASSPAVRKVAAAEQLVVERNVIELATFPALPELPPGTPGGGLVPLGIGVTDAGPGLPLAPDYAHGTVVLRENVVRYLDGLLDPTYLGTALEVAGARTLVVRDHIVESVSPNALRSARCGAVTYQNNRTPEGLLLPRVDVETLKFIPEFDVEAEDALVLSLFNR